MKKKMQNYPEENLNPSSSSSETFCNLPMSSCCPAFFPAGTLTSDFCTMSIVDWFFWGGLLDPLCCDVLILFELWEIRWKLFIRDYKKPDLSSLDQT